MATQTTAKIVVKKAKAKSESFAVIMTGGKQYVVSVGDVLKVELLGDHKEGDAIEFDQVLMTDDGKVAKVGSPTTGTKVKATYLGEKKGPKLTIVRYKAKSNRDRRIGHRQHYAEVKIESL
ncbi:50S ribosomal protein L21 [Patescibacteria group bacterium]|nr:50S ribosomal protein L21 [Patescibacteria group bacterium]